MYVFPYCILIALRDSSTSPLLLGLCIPSLSILLRARLAIWSCLSLLLVVAPVWYSVMTAHVLNPRTPPVVHVSLASFSGSGDLDVVLCQPRLLKSHIL